MDQNQTKNIKKLASELYQAAQEHIHREEAVREISKFFIKGPPIGMDDALRDKQDKLVKKCVDYLGVELGNEEEIEELAWKHFWLNFSDSNLNSIVSEITERFFEDFTRYEQRSYGYLAPNFVLEFVEQAQKIVIGPVEAIQTESLIKNQSEIEATLRIHGMILPEKTQIGSNFDLSISDGRILLDLPQSCWHIPIGSIKAARLNAEEKTIWSVNVALSLLRLSYPSPESKKYPNIGDMEGIPMTEPNNWFFGYASEEKGFVLSKFSQSTKRIATGTGLHMPLSSSVRRKPCHYVVDDAVVEMSEEPGFRNRAHKIFNPAKNSLAERFGQGLGWLSRGRQTADRAERFLFFFTAVEALLSSDDKNAPVVQTISRYAATILHTEPEERANFAKELRKLYSVRSALVHAGKRNVSQAQSMETQKIAEELYKTVMEKYPLDSKFGDFQNSLSKASYGSPWP